MSWPRLLAAALAGPVMTLLIVSFVLPNIHKFTAVATPAETSQMPIVIPRARITSEHEHYIPDNAFIVCDRDLKQCFAHHMPDGLWLTIRKQCNATGACEARVDFVPIWASTLFDVFMLCTFILGIFLLIFCLPVLGDWVALVMSNLVGFTTGDNLAFKQRMLSAQRTNLFVTATKHWSRYSLESEFATYSDKKTMMLFSPEDGFRLYPLWNNAPVVPWRFRKVDHASAPPHICTKWAQAVRMRDTVGVRMRIDPGIDIEWRADGGMRVWIDGSAYDSYIAEPAPTVAPVPDVATPAATTPPAHLPALKI